MNKYLELAKYFYRGGSPIEVTQNTLEKIFQVYKRPSYLDGICWGTFVNEMALNHSAAPFHFAYVGATGSGKTVSIRLLLQTVLPFINNEKFKDLDHRAIIYDAKQDIIPILRGMNLGVEIKTLNPFDDEGFGWDIAEDIKERVHALEISLILIPPDQNSQQPFFGDAARHLLEGVITSFMLNYADGKSEKWTFRDVIYTMGSKERIIEVLNNNEETREIIPLYFEHTETSKNIMSTVATKIKPYKTIAALWHKALEDGRMISLSDWFMHSRQRSEKDNFILSNYILVLGNDETAREAIDRINQAIFKRVSQLILNQRDLGIKREDTCRIEGLREEKIDKRRHWIILDEVRNAGKLDGLNSLLTKGRSKGACIVLGFQDIEGLRSVYGKEEANEIIGQCSHYSIFRLQSPETAEWASSLFSTSEVIDQFTDTSFGKSSSTTRSSSDSSVTSGTNQSVNKRFQYRDKKQVLPAQFLYIKPISQRYGFSGWYKSPNFTRPFGILNFPYEQLFGTEKTVRWLDQVDFNYEMIQRGRSKKGSHDQQKEKYNQQKLKGWTAEERKALGLTVPQEDDESKKEERKRQILAYKAKAEEIEQIAKEYAELVFYREEKLTSDEEEYLSKFPKAMRIFQIALSRLKESVEKDKLPKSDNKSSGKTEFTTFPILE